MSSKDSIVHFWAKIVRQAHHFVGLKESDKQDITNYDNFILGLPDSIRAPIRTKLEGILHDDDSMTRTMGLSAHGVRWK